MLFIFQTKSLFFRSFCSNFKMAERLRLSCTLDKQRLSITADFDVFQRYISPKRHEKGVKWTRMPFPLWEQRAERRPNGRLSGERRLKRSAMEIRGCCDSEPWASFKKGKGTSRSNFFIYFFFVRVAKTHLKANTLNCAPHSIWVSSRDKEKTHTGGNIKNLPFCDRPERFPSQCSLPVTFIYFYRKYRQLVVIYQMN